MSEISDLEHDLNQMLDEAGLNGSLLTTKGPFVVRVLAVRRQIVAKVSDYIVARRPLDGDSQNKS